MEQIAELCNLLAQTQNARDEALEFSAEYEKLVSMLTTKNE